MKILIIGLNYLPESTSIGPYTADLAEYLQGRGHRVQVITGFPLAPQWRIWEGYRGEWFRHEVVGGVAILRTYLYVPGKPVRAVSRILFDLSFSLSSLLGALSTGRSDLIMVISPPLQLGLTGWLLGRLKGARLFVHLQDLVPDAAVAVDSLREGSVSIRLAHALERFVYRRAMGIGVISEGFTRNLVGKGVPPAKITLLPNYIDLNFIRPEDRNNGFRRRQRISPDDFLVMYSGSVALKQGLHTFVQSAAEFQPGDGVMFYLVGDGPYLPELKARAEQLQPADLRFLPLQPRESLPTQLGAADALVITQRRAVTDVVFPGKLLYYMAAGRPILAAVSADSETGRFVRDKQVGVVVPPEDPAGLAQAVRFLHENRQEANRLGMNGRRVAEEEFDREVVLRRFTEHLERLVRSAGGGD